MPILLSRSLRRKLLATVLAGAGFLLLYEATVIDSRSARLDDDATGAGAEAGQTLGFEATAYCKGTTTASGVRVRSGIVAADPKILPAGSVIEVAGVPEPYRGIYTVLDTGPAIQGRIIDVYMWSCYEALDFGRRAVDVTVLRLGWSPVNSAPGGGRP